MASVAEICNRALQKLGEKRITSITEDSVPARACNACYEVLRDSELRAHLWNFAVKRASLAADSAEPEFGPAVQYSLPSDFLRLLPNDSWRNLNDLDWQIEGRKILTSDAAPLEIRYIYRVTDPNDMDPLFREALSSKMAEEMAEQLTQSNSKKTEAKDSYKDAIAKAKRTNAFENVAQEPPEDTWLTVR